MNTEELVENLELFDDWSDRYEYIIGLGRKLPPLPDDFRTDTYKVRGCISQVWLKSEVVEDSPRRLEFLGDSDSAIVKGLFAILRVIYSGRTAAEILAVDLDAVFAQLGLEQHISPNRRNGFFSMVEEIKKSAAVVRQLEKN